MVKIAVMGFGTVGSGVYEIVKSKDFAKKAGEDIDVKYILDIRDFPGHEAEHLLTKEFEDILNDPEVGVVAEVMAVCIRRMSLPKSFWRRAKTS